MDFIQQFISEEIIYALGWTVIHSLWQGTLIAVLVAIAMSTLQKKSARLRYEIATFSLFLVFVVSLSTFIIEYDIAQQTSEDTLFPTIHGLLYGSVEPQGFFQEQLFFWSEYFNNHMSLIVSIWFIGVSFFLVRFLGGLGYVQHLKYNHNYPLPLFWQKQMKRLSRRLPIRKSVELLESTLINVPMVIGYFKPVILMPLGAINHLSENEVEAILAHELAHISRNDFLLNIFFSFIEVLFYYNPAVWWISGNVRLERENCCDDLAIRLCGNSLTYAKALVSLQEVNQEMPAPHFAMPFSGRKNHLLNRVKRILNQPQNKSKIMEKLTATILLLVTISFLSISANTPFENHKTENNDFFEEMNYPENAVVFIYPEDAEPAIKERFFTQRDSVPVKKKTNKQRIIQRENGQSIDLIVEDGEIIDLKIDGEEIPNDQLEDYTDIVDELIENIEVPTPPSPPSPPRFNEDFEINQSSPPAPPSPPTPPNLDVFGFNKSTKVTTKTGTNGETIIMIENGKEEPMEIVVQSDAGTITIDGNSLESGDTAIIIDQNNLHGNHFFQFDGDQNLRFEGGNTDFSFFQKDSKALDDWIETLKNNQEAHGAQIQEHQERMKEYRQLLNKDLDHDIRDAMKQRREEISQQQKAIREAQKEIRKSQAELRRIESDIRLKEIEIRRQESIVRAKERENRNNTYDHDEVNENHRTNVTTAFDGAGSFNNEIRNTIEAQMIEDGLINDTNKYKYQLTGKSLKINGKKQPKEVWEKYKELYEATSGQSMKRKSKVTVKKF